ncbi:RhoGAP domain protein [Ancylostoma duodenale]|uniref:RhoGAP domain protein n=1 Tax=Ancylostoma duodenale TaxID=51022 RepID=A0A0C2GW55_9BILA|nr:RhoGAP domain protein [Ancylostoma duodenale]
MDINVRGRKQVIRRRIDNGKKSGELVVETAADLGLSHTSYELRLVVGDGAGKTLQGPENVYVVIMSEIERQGIRKRVLQRTDSRGFFGRELDGPTPPQPVMSIVDHLRMNGCDTEGVFRKSPKQSTLKECRSEMERGLVPDYAKYGTHVLASVLKDYLRSIPGKILLSGNYDLWIKEVADETDHEKKIAACKSLLKLLPTAHSILLANVLKLLKKIANSPTSKMTASALSVCLAPSFLESPEQSSDPLEGGKKIPLLVEFLILNAADVMPPGFNADNVFSILNPVDHNANHLCSPVPTCSDDEGSQRTPIIEEVGENSPSLSSLRDDLPSERPPRFLEVIHENDGVLSFSDSDEEPEHILRPLSRASFRSETLRQQSQDTLTKEQEQVQQRSSELFKYDTRLDVKPDRTKEEKVPEDPPSRKESREEATQTPDCGLPRLGDCESRFPAFRGSHSNEAHEPSTHNRMVRKETVIVDCLPRPATTITKDPYHPEESQKPTVHVHPFTPDVPSQEPILRTITERLQSLRDNQLIDSSPRLTRRSHLASEEPVRFRNSYIDCGESPRFSRKFFEPEVVPSPKNTRKSAVIMESRVSREDLYVPLYKPQDLPAKQETPYKCQDPQIITERFSSYCIEPPTDYRLNQDPPRKVELVRSASHRDEKAANFQREMQRAASVKNGRRGDTCVGMDPLEINWSVRQLKTLFQDTRAPSIDTDYTVG